MNVFLGIALQLGATFSFTVMGALVRFIGERVPLGEQIFARSFFALIPLVAMLVGARNSRVRCAPKTHWGTCGAD